MAPIGSGKHEPCSNPWGLASCCLSSSLGSAEPPPARRPRHRPQLLAREVVNGEDPRLHPVDQPLHCRGVPRPCWGLEEGGGNLVARLAFGSLDPGLRYLVGNLHLGHLGEVDRPSAGNDPCPLIAPTPSGAPPSTRRLVGQLVQHDRSLAVGGGGQDEL